MRVAIVGAGFSGIGMAIALRRAGHTDVTVFERSDDIGGVWHHNTYPGAACDVPSYLYSFSADQRRDWTRPCSPQPEILDYLRDVAEAAASTASVRRTREVTSARLRRGRAALDAEHRRRRARRGRRARARLRAAQPPAAAATSRAWTTSRGRASTRPSGTTPSTSRASASPSIGTGASAIQFVPEIAERRRARRRLPAHAAVASCRAATATTAPWAQAAIRRVPGMQKLRRARDAARSWSRASPARRASGRWRWRCARGRAGIHAPPGQGPRAAPPAPARLPDRLQAHPVHLALPAGAAAAERRAGHRARSSASPSAAWSPPTAREREVDAIVYGTGFDAHAFVAPMAVDGRRRAHAGRRRGRAAREAHLGMSVAGLPEPVPALRAEHEPRLRLDHRDGRGADGATSLDALRRAGRDRRGAPSTCAPRCSARRARSCSGGCATRSGRAAAAGTARTATAAS